MGIFNQHSNNNQPHQSFLRGLRGSPGVGFSLTRDGNYDMNNKKLKNVGEGVESSDAVTKHQLETTINSKINSSPSLNNFVKNDSPEVAADLDMKGFSIKNMKVTPADDTSATSRKYVDGKLNTKADKSILSQYIKRDGSVQMVGNLQMNGKRITGLSSVPYYNGEATNKRYVDTKVNAKADKSDLNNKADKSDLNAKADKSDLNDYLKLDGNTPMKGDLNMNNKRITRFPDPQLADEPVTTKFLTLTNTHFYNVFFDLDGNSKMRGIIQMNDKRITGLTNQPNTNDEATNKKYVDTEITKNIIKKSHDAVNVFDYLMKDVNEWSTEYGVKVGTSNFPESPHYWNKRVLNITPVKSGKNYRFKLGLQMFRLKLNQSYSLVIELLNRDYETWQRQQTFINLSGLTIDTFGTRKYQYHHGSGITYYTKSLLTFTKTSNNPPVFVYFEVNFDDNAGDMNTYPKEYKNQVYLVAYGEKGLSHVDTDIYDAHESFEIDKTNIKMLVPLDMNGNKILNASLTLNFSSIFNIIKCDTRFGNDRRSYILVRKDNNHIFSISKPVYINSITFHNKQPFDKNATIYFTGRGLSTNHEIKLSSLVDTGLVRNLTPWLEFISGFGSITLKNVKNNLRFPFDVDIIISLI